MPIFHVPDLRNSRSPAERNIEAVSKIEEAALQGRTWGERLGDRVANAAGQMWFIALHVIWFAGWAAMNFGLLHSVRPFDLFPYPFLTFLVSLEAIFLSLFILMSQSRESRQADRRSHLDLQVNLLAEAEMTKVLQMLQALCAAHGLPEAKDPVVQQLQEETQPENMLRQIVASLPVK
jgi:uncharacterized membrane protein